jgi:hypothetical protein
MRKFCKGCGNKIPRKVPHTGRKTKATRQFCYNCSPIRKSNGHSKEHKSERRRRKEVLVKMLGGHCTKCGYNKSISALSFHHKDPSIKSFDISNNGNLMQDWEVVLKEAKKCKLLCLNCHAELHNDHRNSHLKF